MITGIGEVRLNRGLLMIPPYGRLHKNQMQGTSSLFILQQSIPINLSLVVRDINTMNIIPVRDTDSVFL